MRNRFLGMAAAAGVVVLAWGGGLVWFASGLPSAVADPATPTDAIVVLTGGSERMETGLKLLAEGLAPRLFVSGVGGRTAVQEVITRAEQLDPDLAAKVVVGTAAADTPGNAAETAEWARIYHIASLRLVTAAYHMPRALLELQAAMPNIVIIPHPVFPANVRADWWRAPGTASLFAREYTKFLAASVRRSIATPESGT